MADYFTNFSFNVVLEDTGQRDYALKLFLQMSAIQQGEEIPADFPVALKDFCEDCCFEVEADEPNALWLHSCYGGIDAVCAFVQHLVHKFKLNPVTFEWSHDCSKPRTDAFGGGAAHITAKEIKTLSTSEWLRSLTD
jgi:hypothetical protein